MDSKSYTSTSTGLEIPHVQEVGLWRRHFVPGFGENKGLEQETWFHRLGQGLDIDAFPIATARI